MIHIQSTGRCTTTHNACDCVLRELEALRKIKDAAKAYVEGQWREGIEAMMQESQPEKYGKNRRTLFMEALKDYERAEVKE